MNLIIKGKVVEGNKIGTSIGFPTVNILIDPIINIVNGVYFVTLTIDGYNYKGMANIGTRPTVSNDGTRVLEIYIFGYTGNAYQKTISVKLKNFIRPEHKFNSIDELKKAIEKDMETIKNYV